MINECEKVTFDGVDYFIYTDGRMTRLDEFSAYRSVYGELIECVPHYFPKNNTAKKSGINVFCERGWHSACGKSGECECECHKQPKVQAFKVKISTGSNSSLKIK